MDVTALGIIFRAKFRDELKRTDLFQKVNAAVWNKSWVVHCEPVGTGETALRYLAPYIFRVAISNNRIVALDDGQVTFKYKESATDQVRYTSVTAEEFIRRFLQHVLPDHFVKVRYFGLLSNANRRLLDKARELLSLHLDSDNEKEQTAESGTPDQKSDSLQCPNCGTLMKRVGQLGRSPP